MPERDRDQSVEEMLRRMMPHDASPRAECLDAETLAAWSEGSLRTAEASAVEHHVAGCARCRALMASFIRTTPPLPVTESLWRRWHLGWVVPLATAATAAAIWVALPDDRGAPQVAPAQEANTIARNESPAEPPLPPPAESRPAVAAPQESVRSFERQDQKAKLAESAAGEARQRENAYAGQGGRELADLQAAQPAAPAAPAPAAAAAADRAEADARDARKEAAASATLAPRAARQAFVANQIASRDGSAYWRIVNGQQVERSTDAGVSWSATAIDSTDRLVAAAAPSATVCWIVGAGGSVYLTTDGARFARLPFTEIVDLTSVFATDALSATISSADGRSWRTSNQGKTWSLTR